VNDLRNPTKKYSALTIYKVIVAGHQKCKYINNSFFCCIHQDFKYLPGTKKSSDENNSFQTKYKLENKNLSPLVEKKT